MYSFHTPRLSKIPVMQHHWFTLFPGLDSRIIKCSTQINTVKSSKNVTGKPCSTIPNPPKPDKTRPHSFLCYSNTIDVSIIFLPNLPKLYRISDSRLVFFQAFTQLWISASTSSFSGMARIAPFLVVTMAAAAFAKVSISPSCSSVRFSKSCSSM